MSDEKIRDRFRGVLLGTLCGDALGAPAEGLARNQIVPILGHWLHDMVDRPRFDARAPAMLKAGRYTDDTQMTQALAEALVDMDDTFDMDAVARSFALWFQQFRGYGGKAQKILLRMRQLMAQSANPDEAGLWSRAVGPEVAANGPSFGNGAAMRVAPVALACYPDARRVANLAERQARITGHSHEDALFGAQHQALAVLLAIRTGEAGRVLGPGFVSDLRALLPVPPESFDRRLTWITDHLDASGDEVVAQIGHGVTMAESVPTALWAVLSSPPERGVEGAIIRAVNLGGDADTIGAMAGAIAGGFYGASGLPQRWLDAVESGDIELEIAGRRATYGHGRDRLMALADELLDLAMRGGLAVGRPVRAVGVERLALFYRDDMAPVDQPGNYSKSPTKPRRFLEFLRQTPVWAHVQLRQEFAPVSRQDLLLAHKPEYVDAFLDGKQPLCESNGLVWSPAFRDSVLLTNGCLLAAVTAACDSPAQVTMAPVSGFHHARPNGGSGFCTFSGQVIAGLKLYREQGLRGAWIDLDGHFGNSIEDSRAFAPDLNNAIPRGLNVNPEGNHEAYLADLVRGLQKVEEAVALGAIDYVAVAHGADSHEWDQLGRQCTTAEWLQASERVYQMLARARRARDVAVTLALFGGYRDDHPESVLGLHAMDTARCLAWLGGIEDLHGYEAEVRAPAGASGKHR